MIRFKKSGAVAEFQLINLLKASSEIILSAQSMAINWAQPLCKKRLM
jgi:hypothetical protein